MSRPIYRIRIKATGEETTAYNHSATGRFVDRRDYKTDFAKDEVEVINR